MGFIDEDEAAWQFGEQLAAGRTAAGVAGRCIAHFAQATFAYPVIDHAFQNAGCHAEFASQHVQGEGGASVFKGGQDSL